MANASILAAFERMWQHVVAALGNKSDINHSHNDLYYTETEVDTKLSGKANSSHNHAASNITSGTLSSDRLPTIPIAKGGTGATTAAEVLTNLGITATAAELNKMDGVTATATELNYMDGVKSNVQAQLDSKVDENHTHSWDALDDKPFYETEPVDTIIIPTLTFNNWYYESETTLAPLVAGQKGTVVYDGVTYNNVECKDDGNGIVILGNVNGRHDDYPFAVYITGGYLFINTPYASGSVSHTIQVTIGVTNVIKLDEKFLPNFAGEVVSNKTFDGYEEVGGTFAEIFNDYNDNVATGDYAHAEGKATKAFGDNSHSEGKQTTASGVNSHAEGEYSVANGSASHAEGYSCTTEAAYGNHAEGFYTTAKKDASHSEGYYTIAGSSNQHVQGKYNIEDASEQYAHIVGNGDYNARSNAHTLDWDGNGWFAGNVYVGGTSQDDASKLISEAEEITIEEIDTLCANTLPEESLTETQVDTLYNSIV